MSVPTLSQPASVLSSASNLVFLASRIPNHSTTLVISLSPARPVTSRMCVTSFECKWIMKDCVFSHWPTKGNTPRIICCLSLKVKKHFYPIIPSVCTFWKLHRFQFTLTDDNENSAWRQTLHLSLLLLEPPGEPAKSMSRRRHKEQISSGWFLLSNKFVPETSIILPSSLTTPSYSNIDLFSSSQGPRGEPANLFRLCILVCLFPYKTLLRCFS